MIKEFDGSLTGHLVDLKKPEKDTQNRLSDEADPDSGCYDSILN